MQHFQKNAEAVALRINQARKSGISNIPGLTLEEIRDGYLRTFRKNETEDSCQTQGIHGSSKEKHILG